MVCCWRSPRGRRHRRRPGPRRRTTLRTRCTSSSCIQGFAQNRLVYLAYPKYGPRGNTIAVGRGKLTGDALVDFQEIFVSDAWESYGANPGRMLFGRDGTLYVTVGDRDRYCCDGSENNSQRMKAQTLDNDYGKILRIRDDGSIPPDNPFVGRPGALPEIFSYGHRNAYGLAYHPETGELWESEIGPLGGDEINILFPGHNYGWPLVSTGRNYTGTPVSDHPWTREGMDDPRMFWNPVISPSGLIFYTGDRFKGWKGSAFLGALNGKALWRVSFNNPRPQQAEQHEVAPDLAGRPDPRRAAGPRRQPVHRHGARVGGCGARRNRDAHRTGALTARAAAAAASTAAAQASVTYADFASGQPALYSASSLPHARSASGLL